MAALFHLPGLRGTISAFRQTVSTSTQTDRPNAALHDTTVRTAMRSPLW
jgi:hypothetical protein